MNKPHATPAELPLPGGTPEASVVLHPLLSAVTRGPVGWFHRADGASATLKAFGVGVPKDQHIRIPVVSFLVEHPSAGPLLIDTGFHHTAATHPRQNLGLFGARTARGMTMDANQTVAAQCKSRGIDPSAIDVIVMTHLHFDHASALTDFPSATVLVTEPEWNSALGPRASLNGYVRAQFDPGLAYRTIDFAKLGARAHGPFDSALDLFGDGSIVLLSTPGHSAGHISIILRLRDREALRAGDAIYTMATLREGKRPWRIPDARAFEHSVRAIEAYDREHPQALIIPGHDMENWERLETSYT
jgi:glyoxylase-like metal-dependent hydrolase (beta-lactamase superfamily II)